MPKYIKKLTAECATAPTDENDYVFSEGAVQGARVGKRDGALYVISPRRFKLYTDGDDTVAILKLSGDGHFKWSRGEIPFSEGDVFRISAVGEYEVNGNAAFTVLRK